MRIARWIGVAATALIACSANAVTISSTFDTDSEGWQVGDVASTTGSTANGPATYVAAGGNPGGYIFTNDVANEVGFIAPTAFTGDLSGFYGGHASFDTYDADPSDPEPVASIILYSAGRSITYDVVGPATTFTSYVIPFTEAGWTEYSGGGFGNGPAVSRSEFLSVLASVDSFAVHADWHSGADDTGLDNVVVTSAAVAAVPEPAPWAMFIGGFGMLGATMRRRRTRLAFA